MKYRLKVVATKSVESFQPTFSLPARSTRLIMLTLVLLEVTVLNSMMSTVCARLDVAFLSPNQLLNSLEEL